MIPAFARTRSSSCVLSKNLDQQTAEIAGDFVIPSGARNLSSILADEKNERFLAPLGMTKQWAAFSATQESILRGGCPVYIPGRQGNRKPGSRLGGRFMASFSGWTKAVLFSVGAGLLGLGFCLATQAQAPPAYKIDAAWPKQLPNNWIMGQVGGMAVDRQDRIWVLQRPGSNTKDDLGAAQSSSHLRNAAFPHRLCSCLTPRAIYVKSWGGPGSGYDWPSSEHSIFVDHAGNVWITGNGAKDRQAIKFTGDGKFILEIGHPSAAPMNNSDTTILGRPAGSIWTKRLTKFISPMVT
jgi:hypothetical protein